MKRKTATLLLALMGSVAVMLAQRPYCDPAIPGDCPSSMAHYWKFDEGTGGLAADVIGSTSGVLTAGPFVGTCGLPSGTRV